jgi:hypothetical protein
MIGEGRGCYLKQWYLYVHQLKSDFSRVDFSPLFIYDSELPTAWAWILPSNSGYFQLFLGASSGFHLPYKSSL